MSYTAPQSFLEPLTAGSGETAKTIDIGVPNLLRDQRENHFGILSVEPRRRVIYQLSDLKSWLEEQKQPPTPTKKGS